MNKKIRKVVFIIFILSVVLWNKVVMPSKREISDLALIKVVGLDIINEGIYKVQHTNVRTDTSSSNTSSFQPSGGSSSGKSSSGGSSSQSQTNEIKNNKLFSVKAATFSDAVRTFQTYTDKTLTGSHVLFFIIGEDFAKNGIDLGLDFNERDYEIRSNSIIYITKKSSSYDFLYKATQSTYDVDQKLASMDKNNDAKSISYKTTILDVQKILYSPDGCGLIPSIEIIDNEKNKNLQQADPSTSPNNSIIDRQTAIAVSDDTLFDFSGYGIIRDKKLIGYLDREESLTANILTNKALGFNINIYLNNDERAVTRDNIFEYKI
jgi:hypothetical protein